MDRNQLIELLMSPANRVKWNELKKTGKLGYAINFQGMNFESANLFGADLRACKLSKTNFRKANLQGAELQGADFEGANMKEAQIQGANLLGASFINSDLSGIRMNDYTITNLWKIENVKCSHIYLNEKRRPAKGSFKEKEFENIFKWIPTLEVLFDKSSFSAIDLSRIALVEVVITSQMPEIDFELRSISNTSSRLRAIVAVREGTLADKEVLELVLHTFNQIDNEAVFRYLDLIDEKEKQIKNKDRLLEHKDERIEQLTNELIEQIKSKKNPNNFNIDSQTIDTININTGEGLIKNKRTNLSRDEVLRLKKFVKPLWDEVSQHDKDMIFDILTKEINISAKAGMIKMTLAKYPFNAIDVLQDNGVVQLFNFFKKQDFK